MCVSVCVCVDGPRRAVTVLYVDVYARIRVRVSHFFFKTCARAKSRLHRAGELPVAK